MAAALATSGTTARAKDAAPESSPSESSRYRPALRTPPALRPFLEHLETGRDAFPDEKTAQEIGARLRELERALVAGRAREGVLTLLASGFRGAPLRPREELLVAEGALEVVRASRPSEEPRLDAGSFADEWSTFTLPLGRVTTAEMLVTSIEVSAEGRARTEIRYDLTGALPEGGRAERVGRFALAWKQGVGGAWQVEEWKVLEDQRSWAVRPVFTEVTQAAFSANESFRRQLSFSLDPWLATLDAVFTKNSMGHHGVSAGDYDGDGRDDLYVSQPAGLPNRLYRNRGDGTFVDATDAAGLAVLDETAQSLFADVDNDGDQDLVLVVTSTGLLLFKNDGGGRFRLAEDAFRVKLQGTPIAIAMADYDRDGFLDVYLCNYSYFMGTNEDKGGAPNPYHDAENGPPNLLLRNDGQGRFADVTAEAGLDAGNSRFSFAAAWGDYDDDGWPDLAVANDFGRKNLYHNEGLRGGKVSFKEVTAAAGVEDYGPGMSAAFFDYDGDGRLDLYFGNMWTDNGLRITAQKGFLPEAPEDVRALFRRHARGNSLFRNRGDGTFEDVTLGARAQMGRWAWSSDALDFDRDGSLDLYVVNGMFTRGTGEEDLDGFFWRQVTARSPLTRVAGTPYDDAWRAINRLLAEKSQASHQRNVFLRGDGRGGFDEVAGSVGLDLDQDGRSFAVLDFDGDGDHDLAVMAARSSPQLRLFRNDFGSPGAGLAVRLVARRGNRDAVGARVTVETDVLRRTSVVKAGSGFISQHSRELVFGLGASTRVRAVEIRWPDGEAQTLTDLPLARRIVVEQGGGAPRIEAFAGPVGDVQAMAPAVAGAEAALPTATWLYEPCPAPDFSLPDLSGATHTLSGLRGRPALLVFWTSAAAPAREALAELARSRTALERAGLGLLAVALDPPGGAESVRRAAAAFPAVPVVLGGTETGLAYFLLNNHLFVTREDLRLPTAFLLNGKGEVVRVYRDRLGANEVVADAAQVDVPPTDRLARALPFPGRLYASPGARNALQLGLELAEQGLEAVALAAFERAARGEPNAFTLYSLGTLYLKKGAAAQARAAFERALEVKPDFPEASNGLGAVLGQAGDLPRAIARFKVALEATPDYPDALNNLGYALLQQGQSAAAFEAFQKALALQPDFPEAYNNLGIHAARAGDPPGAERHFRLALEKRPGYGEAGNNLALVLMARQDVAGATAVLQGLLQENPDFEMTYVTLAKVLLATGRRREGTQVLERLLQKNPDHPLGQQLARDLRAAQ